MTQYPKYSIVIPAYNESARIPATLAVGGRLHPRQRMAAEVIVVNDGSTIRLPMWCATLPACARGPPSREPRQSRQRLQRAPWRSAGLGEVVMFTDSDLSAPIEEAERLFAAIARAPTSPSARAGSRADARPTASRFTASFSGAASMPCPAWSCGFPSPIPNADSRPSPAPPHRPSSSCKPSRAGASTRRSSLSRSSVASIVEVPVSWAHDERTRMSYLKDGLQDAEGTRHHSLECIHRTL